MGSRGAPAERCACEREGRAQSVWRSLPRKSPRARPTVLIERRELRASAPLAARIGGLGGPAGSDLLRKFAGLRIGPASVGCACPAFMRTRYSWSTVSTTAEPKTRLDSLVARSKTRPISGETPASTAAGYLRSCHRRRRFVLMRPSPRVRINSLADNCLADAWVWRWLVGCYGSTPA